MAYRVVGNSFVLGGSEIVKRAANFLSLILVVRILDPDDFGRLSLALTIVGLGMVLAGFGLDGLVTREVARKPSQAWHLLLCSLIGKAASGILALACVGIIGGIVGSNSVLAALVFIAPTLILDSLRYTIKAVYFGLQQMLFGTIPDVAEALTRLMIMAGLSWTGAGLGGVAATYLASSLAGFGFSLLLIARMPWASLKTRPRLSEAGRLLKQAVPFVLYGALFSVYFHADVFVLRYFAGDASLGYYSAAYRFVDTLMFVPAMIMGALYPAFSALALRSPQSLLTAVQRSLRYTSMVGLPIAVGGTVLARQIVRLMYGAGWDRSAECLAILVWALALIFISGLFPPLLNSLGRQWAATSVLVAGLVFNIALNVILVPIWGNIGSALATVLTEVATIGVYWVITKKVLGRLSLIAPFAKPALASIMMAIVLLVVPELPVWLNVPLGAAVYILALLLFRGVDYADLQTLGLWKPRGLMGGMPKEEV